MSCASSSAPIRDGAGKPAGEVALLGRDSLEQVVESIREAFCGHHDLSRRLAARSFVVADGQELGKAGDHGEGGLELVREGRKLVVGTLGFRPLCVRCQCSGPLRGNSAFSMQPPFGKIPDYSGAETSGSAATFTNELDESFDEVRLELTP